MKLLNSNKVRLSIVCLLSFSAFVFAAQPIAKATVPPPTDEIPRGQIPNEDRALAPTDHYSAGVNDVDKANLPKDGSDSVGASSGSKPSTTSRQSASSRDLSTAGSTSPNAGNTSASAPANSMGTKSDKTSASASADTLPSVPEAVGVRQDYISTVENKLKTWDTLLDRVQAGTYSDPKISKRMSADQRAQFVSDLRKMRTEVKTNLEELRTAPGDQWKVSQSKVQQGLADMRSKFSNKLAE